MDKKILEMFCNKYNDYCLDEDFGDFEPVSVDDFDSVFKEKEVGFVYTSLQSDEHEDRCIELVYAPLSQTYTARLFLEDRVVTCSGRWDIFQTMDLLDSGFMACYHFAIGCFMDLVGEDD